MYYHAKHNENLLIFVCKLKLELIIQHNCHPLVDVRPILITYFFTSIKKTWIVTQDEGTIDNGSESITEIQSSGYKTYYKAKQWDTNTFMHHLGKHSNLRFEIWLKNSWPEWD